MASDQKNLSTEELREILLEEFGELVEGALGEAFTAKHDIYVQSVVNLLRENTALRGKVIEESVPVQWIEIESLSRLRGVVGGRFQNLKNRWVAAGFPLRAHRGDKSADYELNSEGWVELSNWILKQGFEARLTPEKPEVIFELRER